MIDFLTLDYLKSGNERQQQAFEILIRQAVFEKLSEFSPVLVGTIPINIDIASSDLDIACYWNDKKYFTAQVTQAFGNEIGFEITETLISNRETIIASFFIDNFEIEIFGQNIPVVQQYGYRHMLIENKILQQEGKEFRKKIIALKEQGYKTEPAFAELLGLEGNPYEALLELE